MDSRNILIISSFIFFTMFIYSGFDKIGSFDKKVDGLKQKLDLPIPILNLGMFLVILLEIFAPLIIITRMYMGKSSSQFLINISNLMFILLILFLVVVTMIYHPPSCKKMIPFLSNCTTLAGTIFLFIITNSDLINV